MAKPRLLIPITINFSVRYILRTGLLEKIIDYAQPVVLLGWSDEDLKAEIESLGAEVYELPQVLSNKKYETVRQQIEIWHRSRLNSPSTGIDESRSNLERSFRQRLRKKANKLLIQAKFLLPGRIEKLFSFEKEYLWEETNFQLILEFVRSLRIDSVFCLTPYLRNEEFVLRAAKHLKVPMATSILSFDNITTRGWIPVLFDQYFLWNKYNEQELRRIYPEADNCPVTIVGAPQFDFYWNNSYLWDEIVWRKNLSLPLDRPVLLFGGGPPLITSLEPYWVSQIDEAICDCKIENNPIVLVRPHPLDTLERWLTFLKVARNIYYDVPWKTGDEPGYVNIKRADIEKLASTLYHSQVHINTSSTMTLDGAIFDRPQIGPAYDDRAGRKYDRASRELYDREHYLPITKSGGLQIVYSLSEMIQAINSAFKIPELGHEKRKKMIMEICTFDDGKATERVDSAIRSFLRGNVILG